MVAFCIIVLTLHCPFPPSCLFLLFLWYAQKSQLREIEQSSCSTIINGMPIRARSVFGNILASMTTKEQRNVQEECKWSKRSDIPDVSARQRTGPEYSPNSSGTVDGNSTSKPVASSQSAVQEKAVPLKAARKKRQQMKQTAEQKGTQYGKSKHATEDDDMWNLMSNTIVLKGNQGIKATPLSLSPIRKRPNTAPNNPFGGGGGGKTKQRNGRRVGSRLQVGICSPSFYGRRNPTNGMATRPSTAGTPTMMLTSQAQPSMT